MPDDPLSAMFAPLVIGAGALAVLFGLVWWISRRNRSEPERPGLWDGRDYPCPVCGKPLLQGWVLLGKGAIWSDRARGRPGAFTHIGQSLPNTLSMRLRPAANMAWRCPTCRMLLIDHDKLVH